MSECVEIRAQLVDFAFGDLPPRRMGQVGVHLGGCTACLAELKEIESTLDLAALWEAPEPPALAVPIPQSSNMPCRLRLSRRRAAIAAAVLLSFAAGTLWRPFPTGQPAPPPSPVDPDKSSPETSQEPVATFLSGRTPQDAYRNAPRFMDEVKAALPHALDLLVGQVRTGPASVRPTALACLAGISAVRAIEEVRGMLDRPAQAAESMRTLREVEVDASFLAPDLIRAAGRQKSEELLAAAQFLVRKGGADLDLRSVLREWEVLLERDPAFGQALEEAVSLQLAAASNKELEKLLARGLGDRSWKRAIGILAKRDENRAVRALVAALTRPSRRQESLALMDGLADGPARSQACDGAVWHWHLSGGKAADLPQIAGIQEALGRLLARASEDEARRLMARIAGSRERVADEAAVERCDRVLEAALAAAERPVPVLRLIAQYGSPALMEPVQETLRRDPSVRGIALFTLSVLESVKDGKEEITEIRELLAGGCVRRERERAGQDVPPRGAEGPGPAERSEVGCPGAQRSVEGFARDAIWAEAGCRGPN